MSLNLAAENTIVVIELMANGFSAAMKDPLEGSLWLLLKTGVFRFYYLFHFIAPICGRKADTLLPIIRDWILPGTIIISDFWRAYDCLDREGYQHIKVNHSLHFKVYKYIIIS
jgi:hypothetical protein